MALYKSRVAPPPSFHEVYQLAKQVLIIDSSPLSVRLIANEIIDLNHEYIGFADCIEKVEQMLAGQNPDIILINSHIDGSLSGFQIAKILKLEYDIPFFMMCSGSDCETHKYLSELNPDGLLYLTDSTHSIPYQLDKILN